MNRCPTCNGVDLDLRKNGDVYCNNCKKVVGRWKS